MSEGRFAHAGPGWCLALVALAACGDGAARREDPAGRAADGGVTVVATVASVWVDRAGQVYYDRTPIALDALRDSLALLRDRPRTSLWFARAVPDSAPTPGQLAALQAVMDAKISVRLVEPGAPELGQMAPPGAVP